MFNSKDDVDMYLAAKRTKEQFNNELRDSSGRLIYPILGKPAIVKTIDEFHEKDFNNIANNLHEQLSEIRKVTIKS